MLEKKQDFTNFVWQGNVKFVCDSDTILSAMSPTDATKLYHDIRSGKKGDVSLKQIGNTMYYIY